MAYKFQLGSAVLSGSLTQEGQILAKDSALSGSSLSIGGVAVSSTAAELNKLDGTDADVTAAKLNTLCDLSDAEIGFIDGVSAGTAAASKAVVLDASKDVTGVRNLTLEGNLTVQGTTTQVDTTNLQVKDKNILINDGGSASSAGGAGLDIEEDGSVTGFVKVSPNRLGWEFQAPGSNATIHLSASVSATASLAGNLTTAGAVTISTFGASIIDDADAAAVRTTLGLGSMATQANNSVNIDGGDIASAVTINKSPVITLGGDLTGNCTLTELGNATLTATIAARSVEGSMLSDTAVSGLTASLASGLASSDQFIVSDNGSIKKMNASVLKTFIGGGTIAVNSIGDANASLAIGLNTPEASASAQRTWTVPASASLSIGDAVVIKAYSNAGTYPIKITGSGQQGFEAENHDSITLESDSAAITLYYVDENTFIVV